MDYNLLLDMIEIFAGGYMAYLAVRMKQTGVIADNGLISKGIDLNKAPDPMGYIKAMFPWHFGVGVVLFICGVISRICSVYVDFYNNFVIANTFAAAIAIVIYCVVSMKAQKKYLIP